MITAYAQHLGIILREPAVELPEQRSLGGSTRGEIEDVKGQDHLLLAPVLAESNITLTHRREGKIWRDIANLCGHIPTFLDTNSGQHSHPGDRPKDYTPGPAVWRQAGPATSSASPGKQGAGFMLVSPVGAQAGVQRTGGVDAHRDTLLIHE